MCMCVFVCVYVKGRTHGINFSLSDFRVKDKVPLGQITLVKLILMCFNSVFVTNDFFYLPLRHTSQLISIYYLWVVLSQKSHYSSALSMLHTQQH